MSEFGSRIIEFDIETHSFRQISLDEFAIDPHAPHKIYWIHSNLRERDFFHHIIKKLHLPPDMIELCDQEDFIPKLIDTNDSLTLQIQCLKATEFDEFHDIDFDNLVIYLTSRYCFTAAFESVPVLIEFSESYDKAIQFAKTPCFILFLLMDNAINDYGKMIFNFELRVDQIEESALTSDPNIYSEVMSVKQQLMKVKRYSLALREFLMRISSRNIAVVSDQCRQSLYNLSSHSHTVVHEIDSIRDMLNGILDQLDNALMQKLSETMKVLTAFAAIFLPLTLITGIYGMNFHWIPELNWKYGYFGALGLIVVCGVGLFIVFRKLKWF